MSPADALVLAAVQLLTQAAALGHAGARAALDAMADPSAVTPNRRAMSNAERQKRYRDRNAGRNENVTPAVTAPSFSSSSESAEKEQNLSEGLQNAREELTLEPVTEIVTRNVTRNANGEAANLRAAALRDDVSAVFGHWLTVMCKDPVRSKLTPQRRAKVEARLKEGYTVADIKAAIDGCKRSPFHMGENDSNQPYNDLEQICRSGRHVEDHLARLVGRGQRTNAATPKSHRLLT